MENLLQQAKFLESRIDSVEKLEQFKLIVAELKQSGDNDKTIHKLEEKVIYYTDCLNNKQDKENLLAQLQAIIEHEGDDFSNEVNKLQRQFNSVGYAGKNTDEALSRMFKEALFKIQDKKDALKNQRIAQFIEKQNLKKALIEKTKKVAQLENFNDANQKLNTIFDEWKAIGFSGKEEDALWNEFQKQRQVFFDRRRQYFDNLNQSHQENAKAKMELIAKAKEMVAKEDYSNEMADAFKALDVAWKAVKNAGKQEETLWEEFKKTKSLFWDKRMAISNEKFEAFKVTATEIIERKTSQIENLNQQILDLRTKVGSLRNDEQIQRMKGWIDEKVSIVEKLEKEVENLKKRIHQ